MRVSVVLVFRRFGEREVGERVRETKKKVDKRNLQREREIGRFLLSPKTPPPPFFQRACH